MAAHISALLIAALMFPAAPAVRDDDAKIEGTWTCTKAERDGEATDEPVGSRVVFAEGKITIHDEKANREHKGTYKLDDSKSPRWVTLTPEDTENPDERELVGIYEIKGDELKLCLAAPKGERPSDFTTSDGSMRMLLTLKREK